MISNLKPYLEYKESGLPWLGQVPRHWETRPAFGVFKPNQEHNLGMKEKTVLSLSYGRIVIKPMEKLHGLVPESFETYQIVNPGDIILRTTDLQNDHTSLRVGMVRDRGIITSAYLALQVSIDVNPEFGFQFLNVWDLSKAIYSYGSGLRQNLDFSHFKRMPVALPPLDEQAAIVRFLNWANWRLERAIRAKRKVIALLNEQKQAIIHRAVTRGLDPSVPLKTSGIPLLGDIPQHWEVMPFCAIARPKKVTNDGNRELLSVYLGQGVIPFSAVDEKRTNPTSEDLSKYQIVEPGDFVLNNQQAWRGSVGVSRYDGIVSPAYLVLTLGNRLQREFADRLLSDRVLVTQYLICSKGVGTIQRNLYWPHLRRASILIPPMAEQVEIVRFLEEATASLGTAIEQISREIDLVREYRTRLVADVVTGKLDVRDTAARLTDEVEEQKKNNNDNEEELGTDDDELVEENHYAD